MSPEFVTFLLYQETNEAFYSAAMRKVLTRKVLTRKVLTRKDLKGKVLNLKIGA